MADEETAEDERVEDEASGADKSSKEDETPDTDAASKSDAPEGEASDGDETQQTTAPGEWERKPADKEDLRHDDDSEPLAEPSDDDDDNLAEKEAGDARDDDGEGPDRPDPPDEAGMEDAGETLERHGEPLLQGSGVKTPVGEVPSQSLVAMAAFIAVFCLAFFGLWALLGTFGILIGILAGAALGLGAMKLVADRAA